MSRITSSDKAMQTERKPTAKRRRKEKVEAKDQGSKQPLTNYEYSLLVSCFHLLFLKYNCSFWRLCIRLWIPSWRNTMTRNIRYSGACMSNSSPIAQSWRGHCTSDLWHDNMTCITRGCCILVHPTHLLPCFLALFTFFCGSLGYLHIYMQSVLLPWWKRMYNVSKFDCRTRWPIVIEICSALIAPFSLYSVKTITEISLLW
jgi:hypothetical protein